jgi:hypothetical protein
MASAAPPVVSSLAMSTALNAFRYFLSSMSASLALLSSSELLVFVE